MAEAFGVREDTVWLWRGDFGKGGVDALKARIAQRAPSTRTSVSIDVPCGLQVVNTFAIGDAASDQQAARPQPQRGGVEILGFKISRRATGPIVKALSLGAVTCRQALRFSGYIAQKMQLGIGAIVKATPMTR
jgi:hypothetical protein